MNDVPDTLIAALRGSELLVGLFDAQDQLCWSNARFDALPAQPSRRRDPAQPRYRLELDDGRTLWVSETLQPDGSLLWVAAELASAPAAPAQPSAAEQRDVLQRAAAALGEPRGRRQPFSIAVVEIGDGAQAQPGLLNTFVRQCRQHLRPGDTLSPLSDGEFLLLLPGAGPLAATAIVERLHRRLSDAAPAAPGATAPYRFSAGLAQAKSGEELEALLQRARRALASARERAPGLSRIVFLDA
jgi:GGDEF domain-containing protein